jgi:hypothetical protein
MRPKASIRRWALGLATALALCFSPLVAAQMATAVGPTTHQTTMTNHVSGSALQAKKKKRHRSRITNPDTLPQPLIEIIPGSSINLLSRTSKLPIAIKNGYDTEVRVRVRVQASNLKVLIPAVVEVLIPANTTITAKVPVNAIADGPVTLHATLETFSGLRLTVPVDIQMNVILGVEDTVLYGFVGFIALLAAFGVFRTIRKRRGELESQEGQAA